MADAWPIRTVVFDLDDTLFPEAEYVRSGFGAVDRWLREHEHVEGFGAAACAHFEAGLRGKIFDAALADLKIAATPERVAQLVDVYRSHTPQLTLEPSVRALLDALASQFQLAVLTDGYAAVQRRKFNALGLSRWVTCVIVTDEFGREFWKPHPAGFERIMARFGGAPAGFVYVADNPRKDFLAPKQLGWRTVRFVRQGGEHVRYSPTTAEQAEVELTNLAELMSLLRPLAHSA